MTARQSPIFQSLTTTEQAAHLDSIPAPDPDRLQREYEAVMLEKAQACQTDVRLGKVDYCDTAVTMLARYEGADMREREAGARFAAIVLSKQAIRHLAA